MYLVAAFAFITGFSVARAQAEYIHIVAQGQNRVSEVAPVYSCLAYSGCEKTIFRLGKNRRLHIYTRQSLVAIKYHLARCDLKSARVFSLGTVDDETKKFTPIEFVSVAHKLHLEPAVPSERTIEQGRNLHQRSIRQHSLNVDSMLIALEGRLFGYSVSQSRLPPRTLARTNDEQKTIVFSDQIGGNILEAFRHELDHVLQHHQWASCEQRGIKGSTFDSPVDSERAAYLNNLHSGLGDAQWEAELLKQLQTHDFNVDGQLLSEIEQRHDNTPPIAEPEPEERPRRFKLFAVSVNIARHG